MTILDKLFYLIVIVGLLFIGFAIGQEINYSSDIKHSDMLIILIALSTLIFLVNQEEKINHQRKLSVKPHLTAKGGDTKKIIDGDEYVKQFIFEISNNGLGPALIKDVKIKIDNVDMEIESGEILNAIGNYFKKQAKIEIAVLKVGDSFKDGAKKEFINITFINDDDLPTLEEMNIFRSTSDFEIKYTSMYEDEIWICNPI